MNELENKASLIEAFHVLFLSFFGKKANKQAYALKGGCNLRFFFHSPRYSEDMDLDIQGIPVFSLQETVGAILRSVSLAQALALHRIRIEHISEHKQSETTQRWKLGLWIPREDRPVPTKIEFSRRGFHGEPVFERIHPEISNRYRIAPFMCPHYPGAIACRQKIEALASRSVTQARDVFDLWLLGSDEPLRQARASLNPAQVASASRNLASLSYDHFQSQVIPYLSPDDQHLYGSAEAWDRMQIELMDKLEPPL
ncbi:MAG: nucleotidyl transferase AbiEii/AbiGii toxin family protein [Kiritimatiellia bacterium]|nr:nucleotidyl transferase AbiEii/AbiGii toxin family protein [Kiritimatiellia bacterium]